MTTRKEVIINLYNEVYDYSNTYFPKAFPNPTQVDAIDIIFIISMHFSPHYDSGDYRQVITSLISDIDIKVDDFEKHYKNIEKPLHELVKFIKTM